MPVLPPAQAIKCEFAYNFSGDSRNFVNAIYVHRVAGHPILPGDLATLAADIDNLWDTHITPVMSSSVNHFESVYTDLSSDSAPRVITTPNVHGTNGGTAAPLSIAATISWNISRRYRGGHPRSYIGGLVDTQLVPPNTLSPAFETNLGTDAGAVLTGINALTVGSSGFLMVNVSYRSGGVLRAVPLLDPITGVTIHPRIDSQRRRLGKETA